MVSDARREDSCGRTAPYPGWQRHLGRDASLRAHVQIHPDSQQELVADPLHARLAIEGSAVRPSTDRYAAPVPGP
eukprot:2847397-Amphidinium_carterae.1